MNTEFWNSAAINGLLLALASIAFMLLQTILPGYGILLSLLKLVVTIGVLVYFMKQYSKEQEYFSYGNGFRYGFTLSFCSAVAIAIYVFVHYTYLFPDLLETTINASMQAMQNYGNSGSLDLDKWANNMPVIVSVSLFIYAIIWGLIAPAIIANYTKRGQSPFADSEEDD